MWLRIAQKGLGSAWSAGKKTGTCILAMLITFIKDNIAEDTLVHVHFNKIHMKPFVKPRKQSKRL